MSTLSPFPIKTPISTPVKFLLGPIDLNGSATQTILFLNVCCNARETNLSGPIYSKCLCLFPDFLTSSLQHNFINLSLCCTFTTSFLLYRAPSREFNNIHLLSFNCSFLVVGCGCFTFSAAILQLSHLYFTLALVVTHQVQGLSTDIF